MKLIVTNDDFAATYGFTEAIKNTFTKGITTSTSIEVNGPAFTYSVQLLKNSLKTIGLNLHLNLNHGKGYAEELVDKNNNYKYSVFHYFFLFQNPSKRLLQAIKKDLNCQFEIAFKSGLNPTSVNGHNHIHLVPSIFEIVCQLCNKYNIKYIRLPREPFFISQPLNKNIKPFLNKNLGRFLLANYFANQNILTMEKYKMKTTSAFYGLMYTNYMDTWAIKASLFNAIKNGFDSVEILGHPALVNDKRDTNFTCKFMSWYSQTKERTAEAKAFQNQDLKKFIKKNNIELISFNNL